MLQNGNRIEGIIRRADSSSVVVELEYGSITLDRNDVKSLHRTKGGRISGKRKPPSRLRQTVDELRRLESLRSYALSASREAGGNERELAETRDALDRVRAEYAEAQKKLRQTPSRPVRQYNRQVRVVNRLSAEMVGLRTQIEGLEENRGASGTAIPEYSRALRDFSAELSRTKRTLQRTGWRKGEREYLKEVAKTVGEMRRDFQNIEVRVTPAPGDHVIVPVEVNRSVIGYFMVDTGASVVSFSRRFARKLRIDLADAQTTQVILADGKRVGAHRVTLSSVRVGTAKVNRVEAVVLPNPPGKGVDGLLGMSFLRNFVMEMQGNKMVLRKMK